MKKTLTASAVVVMFVVLMGSCAAWWRFSHFLVKTDHGVMLLEKRFLTWDDVVVDARGWTYTEFEKHPEVMKAMSNQGYDDVLAELRKEDLKTAVKDKIEGAESEVLRLKDTVQTKLDQWFGKAQESEPKETEPPATEAQKGDQ
ncbi:MAG: hypothetical protein HN976_40100 [Lentisphaerae bacterium]|jgi:hypothetical protein|nr:hypothetical protein [Lentisphaerota bacterium]MBT7061357.1 hypothetical protein [Lentisphaerota bacterium]